MKHGEWERQRCRVKIGLKLEQPNKSFIGRIGREPEQILCQQIVISPEPPVRSRPAAIARGPDANDLYFSVGAKRFIKEALTG